MAAGEKWGQMSRAQTIDVSRLIDDRGIDRFIVQLLLLCWFIALFDGYDIGAVAYAAPELIKDWHITNPGALGPVFSASLFGILFGSPLFGSMGDRFGRKRAIIASCLTFGVFTWLSVLSRSLHQLFYLRLLAGVGLGGLLPNVIALSAEFAPRRYRVTMIIVMFTGVPLGTGLPGLVSAWLVPTQGWRILFWVGGVTPLVVAMALALWLPESIKYLALKGGREAEARALVARLAPGHALDPGATLLVAEEKHYAGFSPRRLFGDGLALITPLLWFCFAINLMGYYFLASWMPTLLTSFRVLSHGDAALATTLLQVGGTLGSLAVCRPMDTKGLAPLTVLFAIAVPAIGSVGFLTSSEGLLMLAIFVAGFCVLGLQSGLNAISGTIYPTAYRSNGSGWAFAIGRLGSVTGPIVGGFLIARHLPLRQLFLIAAIPALLGAIASFFLARLYRRRFGSRGIGREEAPAGAVASTMVSEGS